MLFASLAICFEMNERKNIVSMRLTDADRQAIQSIAERLYIRESDVYRFAVKQLLANMEVLLTSSHSGCDLLPLLLELREELIHHLGLKKNQLYNILNSGETKPEKYVSMSDVELLTLSKASLRQQLMHIHEPPEKNIDTDLWLKLYFSEKYFPCGSYEVNSA